MWLFIAPIVADPRLYPPILGSARDTCENLGYVCVRCWPLVLPGTYAEPRIQELRLIQWVIGRDREHQHLTGT